MSGSHAANSARGTLWLFVARHLASLRPTPESDQTITRVQYARYIDSMFGNANLRHIGNDGPSRSLAGGPDLDLDPIRS